MIGEPTLVSYAPLRVPGLNWSIGAKIDEAEALAPVSQLRTRLILVTMMVLIALALAASVTSRRMARPVQELAAASKRIAEGDLHVHVTERTSDEIGVLSRSFNQMADSIRQKTGDERKIERRKRFC